ncbi:hypothetical protein [Candidatus Halobonum tyrrellensis]|uniref:hypothetical protein n=1 Tax=Candidatus Halobonum tyrrellensis TaxID=1431545 RepID=UPI001F236CCD|nr:hypothetical protein [Candidatus Halobonum tyrrellensis]
MLPALGGHPYRRRKRTPPFHQLLCRLIVESGDGITTGDRPVVPWDDRRGGGGLRDGGVPGGRRDDQVDDVEELRLVGCVIVGIDRFDVIR